MALERSDSPGSQTGSPKVEVKAQSSLFLISFTDVPSLSDEWRISVFIDIPTIDFYKDELTNVKLSRFNKQFKLHHLKENIYKSFTSDNEGFWDQWLEYCDHGSSDGRGKFVMRVSSLGSLRYVETIKFLVESVYGKLKRPLRRRLQGAGEELKIEFILDASPTTQKWFSTFLDPEILQNGIVTFNHVGSQTNGMGPSPFKDYYNLLSGKFEECKSKSKSTDLRKRSNKPIDSIVIVTNSTGVKALLTILSDRPLTNVISRESIEMLHNIALKKSHSPSTYTDEETPLKRESSSLLNFQNQLITSNKDKSVKVRSLSINRRSNMAFPLPMNPQSIGVNYASLDDQKEDDYENQLNEEDEEDDYDDENEGENNKSDDEDDDGISFNVPSKLLHTSSSEMISTAWKPGGKNGRVRSLSLMDPALNKPFATTQSGTTGMPLSITTTEDEVSSTENTQVTNIYVHDGDFQDLADVSSTTLRRYRKRQNKLPSRQNSANGLIPPEFYSRISSPSTSASSSNTSLQNLNMASGTFSKMAVAASGGNDQQPGGNTNPLFEKNLINKSFEETRRHNLLGSIIEKLQLRNHQHDKNGLALNFVSNGSVSSQMLDEEDILMSEGVSHDGAANIKNSPENTSDEDDRSNSTMVLPTANKEDDNDAESTNTIVTPSVALDLSKIKLYDDTPAASSSPQSSPRVTPEVPQKYKKAFTLDLYGDDDLENSGGWLLGGNAR